MEIFCNDSTYNQLDSINNHSDIAISSSNTDNNEIKPKGVTRERGYSIKLSDESYEQLRQSAFKIKKTMKEYLHELIILDSKRQKFQKFLAPNLELEHASDKKLFIHDSGLDKTAIVKIKWHKLEDEQTGIYVFCELCESDSCLHVKYALTLPTVFSMQREGHISDTFRHNSSGTSDTIT